MKKLPIKNPSLRYLEQSFKEWLDILGYAPTTVYSMPIMIRELLHSLETQNIRHIRELDVHHIEAHYNKLKERANIRRGGGLSGAYLNKHLHALKKFTEYLRKVGRLELPALQLDSEATEHKLVYLTEEEIQQLFAATYKGGAKPNTRPAQLEAIQSRDRAMLAIYYGCGLRRNEGVHLDVEDIDFDRSILIVRKGKNYKERFVPISDKSRKYLTEYVYDHRAELLRGRKSPALFISYNHSQRMKGQSLNIRLKLLQFLTEDPDLQEKEIGLHTLRHSIATHLLAAGMKLESISRFLGHTSLESTQIYTHVTAEALAKAGLEKQPFNNIPTYEVTRLQEDE